MVDIVLANQSAKPLVGSNNNTTQQIIVIPQSLLTQSNTTTADIVSALKQNQRPIEIKTVNKMAAVAPPRLALKRPLPPLSASAYTKRKESINSCGNSSDDEGSVDSNSPPVRKRANLDHLTQEEKLMRRKLKNRVAAQNARDKKRAKMDDMEGAIDKLQEERNLLRRENERLQELNARLTAENQRLKKGEAIKEEIVMPPSPNDSLPRCSPLPMQLSSQQDQTLVGPRLSKPAALATDFLLPKGLSQGPAAEAAGRATACLFWTCLVASSLLSKVRQQQQPQPPRRSSSAVAKLLPLKKRLTWWEAQPRSASKT